MRAGPVRAYSPPSYGTREQVLADPKLQAIAVPRRLFTHPLAAALGVTVGSMACTSAAYGCVMITPAVYLSEAEALDVINDEFAAYDISLEPAVDGGPQDLPVTPDLAAWSLDIMAEVVLQEDCEAYRDAARELVLQADALCGLEEPGDTAGTPVRDELGASCEAMLSLNSCHPEDIDQFFSDCLRYACRDAHWLGFPDWYEEYDLRYGVQDFVEALRSAGEL